MVGSALGFFEGRSSFAAAALADLAKGVVGVAGSAGRFLEAAAALPLVSADALFFFVAAAVEEEEEAAAAGFLGAGFFLGAGVSSSAGGSAENTAPNHFSPLSEVRALSAPPHNVSMIKHANECAEMQLTDVARFQT